MEIMGCALFVFLGCVVAICLAQDQSEFISLDCGLVPRDMSYSEKTTGVVYISDANFISSGVRKSIKNEYKPNFQQQAWSLRSFPEGIRNCYLLTNLTKGGRYLIRAGFIYGDYDNQNKMPEFDLHLGANLWETVKIKNSSVSVHPEIIHILTSNYLRVCLVKTGDSTPFISYLEVRPLKDDSYVTQSGSLKSFKREYVGAHDDPGFIRFPEDVHDRYWTTYFQEGWTRLTTNRTINEVRENYDVPQRAKRNAAVPTDVGQSLSISFDLEPSSLIYAYLHFAEIEELKANETREFDIFYNGEIWHQAFRPEYLTRVTVFSERSSVSSDGKCQFMIKKTNRSTHPPILNAMEIYTVIDLLQPGTGEDDVDAITRIKSIYGIERESWQGDPCAPQAYLWYGLNCSYNEFNPPRITSLNLSSSGLTGKITDCISNLTKLTYLDLSNNNLSGEVPEFLAQMESLRVINLTGNKLSGLVPADLVKRTREDQLILSVEGNSELCISDSCDQKEKKKKETFFIPFVICVASLFIVVALLLALLIFKRRKQSSNEVALHRHPSIETEDRRFSYFEVMKITNSFERVLGKGGFGVVYHGYLKNKDVAVKMLGESSVQGFDQFKAEVEVLLRIHHRNLVSLVGYCNDGDNLALIYEFMSNRDLKEHLSDESNANTLNWEARLRIVAEAAQGLEYLHNGCRPPIIHRDVKTTNILLDEHFQAKLSDFGLSRSFPAGNATHVYTVVAGSPGFLDPEYMKSNRLTDKSDVYSFGVVLLEIITNQAVIDQTREKSHLSDWVNMMVSEGDIKKIVDPKLKGRFNSNSAWKLIEVAMACVSQSSARRPTMTHVVRELNECLASETSTMLASQNAFSTQLLPRVR